MFADRDSLLSGALELASEIATKSPVAVQGTKVNLIHARDHSVPDGLEYVVSKIAYFKPYNFKFYFIKIQEWQWFLLNNMQ